MLSLVLIIPDATTVVGSQLITEYCCPVCDYSIADVAQYVASRYLTAATARSSLLAGTCYAYQHSPRAAHRPATPSADEPPARHCSTPRLLASCRLITASSLAPDSPLLRSAPTNTATNTATLTSTPTRSSTPTSSPTPIQYDYVSGRLGDWDSGNAIPGSIVKLYKEDVNHVRGGTAVATAVVASNGSWVLQAPVSARGSNFSGYDIVQEPTPANYYNYNVSIPAGSQPALPLNAAFHFEMTETGPKLSSVDGAIFWLRYTGNGPRLDGGSSIIKRVSKTTYYIGGVYEVDSDGTTRSYFGAGGATALRTTSGGSQSVLYLHGDHLGSVSLATDGVGNKASEQDFDPWGGARGSGSISQTTTRNYTGQQLDSTGLLYYHARMYDPGLARFVSGDSIVPQAPSSLAVDAHEKGIVLAVNSQNVVVTDEGFRFQSQRGENTNAPSNPQNLNRYSYVNNNPASHLDPSGHNLTNPGGKVHNRSHRTVLVYGNITAKDFYANCGNGPDHPYSCQLDPSMSQHWVYGSDGSGHKAGGGLSAEDQAKLNSLSPEDQKNLAIANGYDLQGWFVLGAGKDSDTWLHMPDADFVRAADHDTIYEYSQACVVWVICSSSQGSGHATSELYKLADSQEVVITDDLGYLNLSVSGFYFHINPFGTSNGWHHCKYNGDDPSHPTCEYGTVR